jgi:hypothetical protein
MTMNPTMKNPAKAYVSWVPAEKGGRRQPPSGPLYSTLVRFDDDPRWPHEAWSLVVRCLEPYDDGRFWFAEVAFLFHDAPIQLRHENARFQLYEGRRMTATGIVLAATDEPPTGAEQFEATLLC